MTELKRTPLWAAHEALGAHFTNFGGWEMPLRYGSELAEHRAVREAAGLFDLSHMGEVWVIGDQAGEALNAALVGNLAILAVGKAKYSLICDEDGGIIDDLIVYRVAESRYLVVPNAGNAECVATLLAERCASFAVEVRDASAETSLIAVQGPNAAAIVRAMVSASDQQAVNELPYYAWVAVTLNTGSSTATGNTGANGDAQAAEASGSQPSGIPVLLARTGYTGEDGFELFLANADAQTAWQLALLRGEDHGLLPAGLAARDSLRLEAGMPLYGNELRREVHPFAAGLGGVVSFKKRDDFPGRTALEAISQAGSDRVLVGLRGEGRRAGRGGYAVHTAGRQIGEITSGQPSPTLGYPIAMAYVETAFAEPGTKLEVDLRGKLEPFEVVPLPFYRRER